MTEITQATGHVIPTIERHKGWRGTDIFVLFVVFLGLAWLTAFLLFPETYQLASFQVGPGFISYLDLYVGFLFFYLCFVLLLYGRKPEIKIRRYSWILLLSFCWLSLLGFIMGNPPKDIFADWKRVWGLFAGVSLAMLLQKSRFEPARIAVVVFGWIPLFLCSVAVTTGLGVISSEGKMGSIGLYVSAQVWATWLPILLCRLVIRRGRWLALPLVLLGVSLVVPAQGTRAIALSVAVSIAGFICWWLAERSLKEQVLGEINETSSAASIPFKTPGRSAFTPAEPPFCDTVKLEIEKRLRLSKRAILILLATLLSCLALAVLLRSPRYSSFASSFFSRLSKEDSIAAENVRIRLKEIQEMLGSMTGTNVVLGKGLGGTYYFSIADELWVKWGLYTTPYLPAPHILIGTLMLKGGLPFFLAGGILFPLASGWAFVSGILRRKRRYLIRLAPYDLAILSSFAMLFTSCLYDAMPLLAISMVISLRLIEGSKDIPGRLKQSGHARGERCT